MLRARPKRRSLNKPEEKEPVSSKRKKTSKEDEEERYEFEEEDEDEDEFSPMDNTDEDSDYNPTKEKTKSSSSEEEEGEEGESKFFKPNSSGARKKPPWYMAKPGTSTNFKSPASFKSPSNFKLGTSTNFKSPAQKQRTLLDSDSSSDEFERVPDSLDDLGGFQRLNKDVKSEDSDREMENDGKEVEYFDFSQIIQNQEVLKAAAIKKERDGGGLGGGKRVKVPSSGRKKVKNSGDDNVDVMELLAMGEGVEFGGMKKKNQSSSEDEDEYEETNRVERNSKGVEVTIAFPSQKKKEKKSCDVEAALKRRFNLVKKENQVFAHKVHLLCWIAHGNYLNSVLNCEDLMGVALSIIPSNYCYPPKRCDLTYLENFVKWFREKVKIDPVLGKDKLRPDKIVTSQSLQVQFNKKMADSRLDQLMLFIATLRALGLMVRLVINLRPVPLKPPVKELFTFKSPQEPVISSRGSGGGGKSNKKDADADSKSGGGKLKKDTDKVKREGGEDGKSKKDADKSKKEEGENKVKKEVNVEKKGEKDGKSKKDTDNLKKKKEGEGENKAKKEVKQEEEENEEEEEEGVTSGKKITEKDHIGLKNDKSEKVTKGKKEKVEEMEEDEEEEKEGENSVKRIAKKDSDASSKNDKSKKITKGKEEKEVEEMDEEDEEEEDVKKTTVEKFGKSGENSSNTKKTTRKSSMEVEVMDSDEENENVEASGEKIEIDNDKKEVCEDNLEKANEKDEPSVKKVARKSLKKDNKGEGNEKEIAAKNMKEKEEELKENGRISSPESSPEIIRRTSKRNQNNTDVAKKEESLTSKVNKRSSKKNVKKGGKNVKIKESEDENLVKDLNTKEIEDQNQVEDLNTKEIEDQNQVEDLKTKEIEDQNLLNDLNTKEIEDKNQVKDLKTKEIGDKSEAKDLKSKENEDNPEDKSQVKANQGRTRSKTAAKSNLDEDIVEEFVCCNSRQRANIVDKSEISRVSRSSTKLAGKDIVTPKPKNFPDEDVGEKKGRGRSSLKKDDDNTPKSKEVPDEKKDGGRRVSKEEGDKNVGRGSRSKSLAGKNMGDKVEEVGKEEKATKRGGKLKEKVEEEMEKKATKKGGKVKERVEEEVEKEKKISKKSVGGTSKYFENKEEPKTNGLKEEERGRGKRQSKKLVEDLKESSDEDEEEKKKKRRVSVGGKKKKNEKKNESDEEFEMESSYFKSKSSKIDRRVLSSDDEAKNEANKKMRKKNATDEWAEVFLEAEEKWICVDLTKGMIHCVQQLYSSASQPVTHVLGWENGRFVKDVTRRYVPHFMTVTRKQRGGVDGEEWWREALRPFAPPRNARNREEDEDLDRQMEDQPLPTSISEYKNHPLYALQRHLLKFQAIYPPDAPTLGFIRNEPVYSRACVAELHCRESWIKFAKVVRAGEEPYKVVKARPKFDKMTGEFRSDLPLPLFGPWQVDDYVPPPAKDGKVPRNEYGNVELFQPSMLPAGTVHLKLPGLNRVAKKLQIDCAQAVVGWDFHGGSSHVVMDGFVVCEEFEETLTEAWHQEQQEAEKRAREKMEQKVYGNWKRLIKGLLIREKLKLKYGFEIEEEVVAGTSGKGHKNKKTAKK